MKKNRSSSLVVNQSWKNGLFIMLGILFGLSVFTFYHAKGASYFLDDPESCMNCHVMREQFESWTQSSHKAVATCNACHTPKDIVGKYASKGLNGWNHSLAFTTGQYQDPIQIKEFNQKIVHKNCIRCHEIQISQMRDFGSAEELDCISCHGNVGHGNRR